MAIIYGTLAKEIDGVVDYIYPKTVASMVEYDPTQSIKDKIDDIDANIVKINNRITTIVDFIGDASGLEPSDPSFDLNVDDVLSPTSTNPVQNKVIYEALNKKASTDYVDDAIKKVENSIQNGDINSDSNLNFTVIKDDVSSDFKNQTGNGKDDNYLTVFKNGTRVKVNSNQEAITLIVGVDINAGDTVEIETAINADITCVKYSPSGNTTVKAYSMFVPISSGDEKVTITAGADVYVKYASSNNSIHTGFAFSSGNANGYISINTAEPEVYIGGGAGDSLLWMKKVAFVEDITTQLLNNIYPIGSIYMNVNNINPSTFLGGVWESWGSGRVPLGVNPDDDRFKNSEMTGGEYNCQLSIYNLPEHDHNIPAHNHDLGNHTHNIPSHNHDLGNHTHNVIPHNHRLGEHTHDIPIHNHSLNDHNHIIAPHIHETVEHFHEIDTLRGSTVNAEPHKHLIGYRPVKVPLAIDIDEDRIITINEIQAFNQSNNIMSDEEMRTHRHDVMTETGITMGEHAFIEPSREYPTENAIGSTGDSEHDLKTINQSESYTEHSEKLLTEPPANNNTGYSYESTTGNAFGNTGNSSDNLKTNTTGSGAAHNNLQPYITCYMWKRIM